MIRLFQLYSRPLLTLGCYRRASAAASPTGLPTPRQALVLAPSRELALQIVSEAVNLAGDDVAHLIVGGTQTVPDQLAMLRSTSAPVIVASPDRLVKLLEAQSAGTGGEPRAQEEREEAGDVVASETEFAPDSEAGRGEGGDSVDVLGNLEVVVLDEVDRMLDSISKVRALSIVACCVCACACVCLCVCVS